MVIKQAKMKKKSKLSGFAQIAKQVNYCARTEDMKPGESLRPIATNCAGDTPEDVLRELEAMASLRPDLKKISDQVILSPEFGDRELTPAEWQKAIDIYREERGLEDAPYAAWLHTDGNEKRHPHHVHLLFIRVKSDGKTVSDSLDSKVNRTASRRIEKELGLTANAGADDKHMFNGRDKQVQRERAAERTGEAPELTNVNPEIVAHCINNSRNAMDLRRQLKEQGIEMKVSRRNGEIYGWKLRNIGAEHWTSGSKLTASNDFGWAKVQEKLNQNFNEPRPIDTSSIRKHPPRPRGLRVTQRPLRQPSLEESMNRAEAEAIRIMNELFAAARRGRSHHARAPEIEENAVVTVLDYGYAAYKFDASNEESFYVQMLDENGIQHRVWGRDFEREFGRMEVRRGDKIRISREGEGVNRQGLVYNKWKIRMIEKGNGAPDVRSHTRPPQKPVHYTIKPTNFTSFFKASAWHDADFIAPDQGESQRPGQAGKLGDFPIPAGAWTKAPELGFSTNDEIKPDSAADKPKPTTSQSPRRKRTHDRPHKTAQHRASNRSRA